MNVSWDFGQNFSCSTILEITLHMYSEGRVAAFIIWTHKNSKVADTRIS